MMRQMMVVLWPSFLVAIVADGFVFSLFDPGDLSLAGSHIGAYSELTRIAAYTIGLFFFWAFCALASMLTVYLINVPDDSR